MVRVQGIITQLIFDHALRIRVKAEVGSASGSTLPSRAPTPDSASFVGASTGPSSEGSSPEESADETVAGDTNGNAAKDKKRKRSGSTVSGSSVGSKTMPQKADEGVKGGNLAGRLNNLITTDLTNLVDGRDFLFIGTCCLS